MNVIRLFALAALAGLALALAIATALSTAHAAAAVTQTSARAVAAVCGSDLDCARYEAAGGRIPNPGGPDYAAQARAILTGGR